MLLPEQKDEINSICAIVALKEYIARFVDVVGRRRWEAAAQQSLCHFLVLSEVEELCGDPSQHLARIIRDKHYSKVLNRVVERADFVLALGLVLACGEARRVDFKRFYRKLKKFLSIDVESFYSGHFVRHACMIEARLEPGRVDQAIFQHEQITRSLRHMRHCKALILRSGGSEMAVERVLRAVAEGRRALEHCEQLFEQLLELIALLAGREAEQRHVAVLDEVVFALLQERPKASYFHILKSSAKKNTSERYTRLRINSFVPWFNRPGETLSQLVTPPQKIEAFEVHKLDKIKRKTQDAEEKNLYETHSLPEQVGARIRIFLKGVQDNYAQLLAELAGLRQVGLSSAPPELVNYVQDCVMLAALSLHLSVKTAGDFLRATPRVLNIALELLAILAEYYASMRGGSSEHLWAHPNFVESLVKLASFDGSRVSGSEAVIAKMSRKANKVLFLVSSRANVQVLLFTAVKMTLLTRVDRAVFTLLQGLVPDQKDVFLLQPEHEKIELVSANYSFNLKEALQKYFTNFTTLFQLLVDLGSRVPTQHTLPLFRKLVSVLDFDQSLEVFKAVSDCFVSLFGAEAQ